ncbi:MAG: poly-gamma-glutamate biosynthesis protein PgsC/CapC [Gemmatimonadota bacterium]
MSLVDELFRGELDLLAINVIFTLYIIGGFLAYERWGLRLGGVLVLPFLALYAIDDLAVLLLFAVASLVTFFGGEVVHRTFLIYGRRMLTAFLILSVWSSFAGNAVLHVSQQGIFMPLLPGLFAYNLHRKGRPLWNTALFIGWLLIFLLATFAVLWLAGVL